MAFSVIMPRQGQSVESCIIAKWFKKQGDAINIGDLLFSYETDKAAFDEESKVAGTILAVYAEEGDDVPVLAPVCLIGNPGEDISLSGTQKETAAVTPVSPASTVGSAATGAAIAPTPAVPLSPPEGTVALQDGRVQISPRARNLADKTGVDTRFAEGSGPHGRIIEKDVLELQAQGHLVTSAAREHLGALSIEGTGLGGRITTGDLNRAVPTVIAFKESTAVSGLADSEIEKISNMRNVIAKAMLASITTTCQLTLNSSFDATDIMAFRKKIKENRERLELENITLNDIIVYAVSRTLANHRDLNAHFLEDKMVYFRNVNIGIAVDTERGLMVPTLVNANLKSLNEISAEIKELAKACQSGTINPDKLKGAGFTITNLGTLDIESFTPVINPPQTGILGVNTIIQRAREVSGEYDFYPAMGLSLTFDHRALDGAPAARFLKELNATLENFSTLLAK
jgi:pyruvate dehydrogenase E2 component (dihydrolipoamide acetyltransferase)